MSIRTYQIVSERRRHRRRRRRRHSNRYGNRHALISESILYTVYCDGDNIIYAHFERNAFIVRELRTPTYFSYKFR